MNIAAIVRTLVAPLTTPDAHARTSTLRTLKAQALARKDIPRFRLYGALLNRQHGLARRIMQQLKEQ